jgi:hypothetical protein
MFLKFGHSNFEIVLDWSETDASPDIRISYFWHHVTTSRNSKALAA